MGWRLPGAENLRAETVNQVSSHRNRYSASVAGAHPGLKCVGMLRAAELQLVLWPTLY
jgi:hypothetical protein